jgi:hypothetical protein
MVIRNLCLLILFNLTFVSFINAQKIVVADGKIKENIVTIDTAKLCLFTLKFPQREDDGVWRSRYDNGVIGDEGEMIKIRRFLFWKKSVRDGEWKNYNMRGELLQIVIYESEVGIKIISDD